jgi:hypothetical protein
MLLRRFFVGAAVVAFFGSTAMAGEGPGLEVRAGFGVGVAEKATSSVDGDEMIEYEGTSLQAAVEVTARLAAEWSVCLRFRGVFGLDDDGAELGGMDGEASFDEFTAGALAGYTLRAGDSFAVTPLAGLSWRSWGLDGEDDFFGMDVSFDAGALVLDAGARAELQLGERLDLTASVLFGLPLTGSNHYRTIFGTVDGDFDGGYFLEAGAGVEYRLNETLVLSGGLAYETASVDWDWDAPTSPDGEDELSRFSIRLGAAVRF